MTSIQTSYKNYVNSLPKDIPLAAFKSAVVSFVFSALITEGNTRIAAFGGALGATVTVISSLTIPFFRKAFGDTRGHINWLAYGAVMVVNLAATQAVVNSMTRYRVNLIAGAIINIAINLLILGFGKVSTDKANPYYLIVR